MARKTRKFSEDVPFSLTSMMDMMTIILVFMIKNLDAEGQLLTQAENLILPVSTSKVQPKEVALTVVVDNNYVVVDNAKIVPTEDVLKQEDLLVTKVDSVLKERRATEQEHALKMGLPADEPEPFVVRGQNLMTAHPVDATITYQEIAHCLDKSIAKIESAIMHVLEQTPPELYSDIVENGIYLSGGGALLRGLDKRLTEKVNIPFHVAEDPLRAVARGTCLALKNTSGYPFLMR